MSKVIWTPFRVISSITLVLVFITPATKSHDPPSTSPKLHDRKPTFYYIVP